MSKTAKVAARAAGLLLAVASIGWIIYRFVETGVVSRVLTSQHVGQLGLAVCIAIPIYAGGLCCAGLAWWCLQVAFLPERPALKPLFATYATTQFAKYLPGNVGHYVGRHLLLRRLGMSHRALLLATLGEAGFLLLASFVWAAGAADALFPTLGFTLSTPRVLIVECVGLLLGFTLLQALRLRFSIVRQWVPLHAPRWLLLVLPCQMLLFAAMAFALMAPARVLLAEASDVWLLPAAAASSWMAGFVVIGAPAGIGVREMVFLTLLKGHMPEADVLLLAAVFRVVTFGGDVLIFLLGLLLGGPPGPGVQGKVQGA